MWSEYEGRARVLSEKQYEKLGLPKKYPYVLLVFPKDCRDNVRIVDHCGELLKEISISEAFRI